MRRSLGNRITKRVLKTFFGFNRPQRYGHLFRLVEELRPRRIMEIGSFRGTRAKQMIEMAARYAPAKEIAYFGFDLFEWLDDEKLATEISKRPPPIAEVRSKLEATGAEIHLHQGDTTALLPKIGPSLPKMDLVFVDGGHSVATIESDWRWVEPLLHARSVVVFDDYWNDTSAGAKRLVDGLDRSRYVVRVLEPEDRFFTPEGKVFGIRMAEVRPRSEGARETT